MLPTCDNKQLKTEHYKCQFLCVDSMLTETQSQLSSGLLTDVKLPFIQAHILLYFHVHCKPFVTMDGTLK